MHFMENITSAGSTDTLRKNVGVRAMEEQRSLNVHSVERNIMDSVWNTELHIITQRFTESRTERGQKRKWQGDP